MMVTGTEKVVLTKHTLNVIFWMRSKALFLICFSHSNALFKSYFSYLSKDVNIKSFTCQLFLKLILFLGPFEIIISWFISSCSFDDIFQKCPKSDFLQRIVKPPSGDTEVSFVGCHMVNTVVLFRKDYVHILEERNPFWQSKICVGPFMKLLKETYHIN